MFRFLGFYRVGKEQARAFGRLTAIALSKEPEAWARALQIFTVRMHPSPHRKIQVGLRQPQGK